MGAVRDKLGRFKAARAENPASRNPEPETPVKVVVNQISNQGAERSAYRKGYTVMSANVTIVGNIVRDPELRTTSTGKSVVNFSVAYTPMQPDGSQGEANYYDVTAWQYLADNLAASLKKGDRVMINGRLRQDKWVNEAGENRSRLVVVADEIGASLRFATVETHKVAKRQAETTDQLIENVEGEDIFAT